MAIQLGRTSAASYCRNSRRSAVLLLIAVIQGLTLCEASDNCITCLYATGVFEYRSLNLIEILTFDKEQLDKLCSSFADVGACFATITDCEQTVEPLFALGDFSWSSISGSLSLLCNDSGKSVFLNSTTCFTSDNFQTNCISPILSLSKSDCRYGEQVRRLRTDCLSDNTTGQCRNETVQLIRNLLDFALPLSSGAITGAASTTATGGSDVVTTSASMSSAVSNVISTLSTCAMLMSSLVATSSVTADRLRHF